jgi:hypothetical protein
MEDRELPTDNGTFKSGDDGTSGLLKDRSETTVAARI